MVLDAVILCATFKSLPTYTLPQILADVLTTNPLSGEIDAVNEPLFNIAVWNAKLAILIFVKPLPSPTNAEPLCRITLPPLINKPPLISAEPEKILTDVLICNPLFGEITASTEPDIILSNLRSCNAFAGILNSPPPSPI